MLFFASTDFQFLLPRELCPLERSPSSGERAERWLDRRYSTDNRCSCWASFLLVPTGEIVLCYESYFMSSLKYLTISFRKLTSICGMVFKSSEPMTENAVLVTWVNLFGFSIVALTVYRTWPYSPSKEEGMFSGSWNWKG